ncbi:MAG TPA: hypothetical protein VFV66_02240 [Nonomuraea sp.]|nr:hypothetical protein [Nonomuraea sp.]
MPEIRPIVYEHDAEGCILLIEDRHTRPVMNGRTFPGGLACAAVHALNNALLYGGINGGISTYRTDGCFI